MTILSGNPGETAQFPNQDCGLHVVDLQAFIMPQEFQVLRCYSCSMFQVHQVKKQPKWQCKVCSEKQSLKKVYGRGTGKDCRKLVQTLNLTAGEVQQNAQLENPIDDFNDYVQDNVDPHSHTEGEDGPRYQESDPLQSKWSEFIEPCDSACDDNNVMDNTMGEGLGIASCGYVATERPAQNRKRKRGGDNLSESNRAMRNKARREDIHGEIEHDPGWLQEDGQGRVHQITSPYSKSFRSQRASKMHPSLMEFEHPRRGDCDSIYDAFEPSVTETREQTTSESHRTRDKGTVFSQLNLLDRHQEKWNQLTDTAAERGGGTCHLETSFVKCGSTSDGGSLTRKRNFKDNQKTKPHLHSSGRSKWSKYTVEDVDDEREDDFGLDHGLHGFVTPNVTPHVQSTLSVTGVQGESWDRPCPESELVVHVKKDAAPCNPPNSKISYNDSIPSYPFYANSRVCNQESHLPHFVTEAIKQKSDHTLPKRTATCTEQQYSAYPGHTTKGQSTDDFNKDTNDVAQIRQNQSDSETHSPAIALKDNNSPERRLHSGKSGTSALPRSMKHVEAIKVFSVPEEDLENLPDDFDVW